MASGWRVEFLKTKQQKRGVVEESETLWVSWPIGVALGVISCGWGRLRDFRLL